MAFSFQELKPHLHGYVTDFLEPSPKGGRGFYECPLCGSGTGPNGTGAFHLQDGNREAWKCFTCGESGDIVDLHAARNGLDSAAAARELESLYNVGGARWDFTPISSSSRPSPSYAPPVGATGPQAGGNPPAPTGHVAAPASAPGAPQDTQDAPLEPALSVDFTPWLDACRANSPLAGNELAGRYLASRGVPVDAAARAGVVVWDASSAASVAAWRPQWGKPPRFNLALVFAYKDGRYWQARNLDPQADKAFRWDKPLADKAGVDPLLGNWNLTGKDKTPLVVVEGPADYVAVTAAGFRALALGTATVRSLPDHLERLAAGVPVIEALDNDKGGRKGAAGDVWGTVASSRPVVSLWEHLQGAGDDPAQYAANHGLEALQRGLQRAGEAPTRQLQAASAGNGLDGFLERNRKRALQPKTRTGFSGLDLALEGGLNPGLCVLGALSSLGKTTFALQVADHVAAMGDRPVIVFSLEQGQDELIAKSLSRLTRLQGGKFGSGINALKARGLSPLMPGEEEALGLAVATYREAAAHLWVYEGVGDLGVKAIRRIVAGHVAAFPSLEPPLVVVDYLQIIAPESDRLTDKQATDKAITELKRLSRDLDIPIVAVSSLNRASYNGPVTMAAFKESGAVEYGSDLLLGIQAAGLQDGESVKVQAENAARVKAHRRALDRDVEVVVLKNRNGPTGATVPLVFEPVFSLFREPMPGEQDEGLHATITL